MMARRRLTVLCFLVLVTGAVGSVWSSRRADFIAQRAALREVLFIPSAKTIKALSLGYTGLVADIYWTRVVQYFGNNHMQSPESYKLLAPLLDITTTLDPKLDVAVQFGAFFLAQKPPEGAGDPDAAVALVRKGIENNPDKWRLYYDLGFIYWIEKQDQERAAEAFEAGYKVPGALYWMKVMAAAMAQGADDAATARMLWTEILKDSKEQNIRWNAERRLMCLDSDELVTRIQQRVDLYRERTGRIPNFRDLVEAGLLRRVPVDPAGNPYEISEDGEVVVSDLRQLPFVTKGLLQGEKPSVVGVSPAALPRSAHGAPAAPHNSVQGGSTDSPRK